jgi:acetoin utilization protein AcuB
VNTVASWMTSNPILLDAEATAETALDLMIDGALRHLPVVDVTGRLVGVISFDDLRAGLPFPVALSAYPSDQDRHAASGLQVADLMTHEPITALESSSLEKAVTEIVVRRIGCLPVVDAAGNPVGIFTETDALRALLARLRGEREQQREAAQGTQQLGERGALAHPAAAG